MKPKQSIFHFALLIWLLVCAINSTAQEQDKIDSLERLLTTRMHDLQRVKVLNKLIIYYSDIDADRSYVLGKEALALIPALKDPAEIAAVYLNWALVSESHGQYLASLEYNFKAFETFKDLKDTVSVSAVLNNVGITYHQLGDYGSSVYYLMKAIELDESRHDTISACQDYINLAEAYYKAKKLDVAASWARKAYFQLTRLNDEYSRPYAAETFSFILIELNKLDSAAIFLKLTEKIASEQNNEYLTNRILEHWGKWYYQQGKLDSAQYFLKLCISKNRNKYQSDILLPAILTLAKTFLDQGKFEQAEIQGHDALQISKSINSVPLLVESSQLLAAIYGRQKKYELEAKYLQTALAYKDSIVTVLQQSSIHGKTIDLTLEREMIDKQRVVSNLEKTQATITTQRFLLTLVGVILCSLLVMLWLIRKSSRERRKVNALLMQKNLELSNLNREVNALIDAIVHDLKSPLNSLQGILYLVGEEVKENEAARVFIDKGNSVIRNGHEIIKQLLELKELEDAPTTLRFEKVRLKAFIQSITLGFQEYAKQKLIQLLETGTDEIVLLDPVMIKRVLDNLISNAIKFSPPNKRVEIIARKAESQIVFEVRDEGPGFHQQDIPKVFGKFQKLSARPTGGESSHGLGLAIVQLIVKSLNGTVELKTEHGNGATFIVTIPITKEE